MRHSVEAYNIYDGNGNVLYDGDIIRYCWGGGNDGNRYNLFQYHKLSISRKGTLKLSGCENIIRSQGLLKIHPNDSVVYQARGLDKPFKEYY